MGSLDELRERVEEATCRHCGSGAIAPHHPDRLRCRRCGWVESVVDLNPRRSLREL